MASDKAVSARAVAKLGRRIAAVESTVRAGRLIDRAELADTLEAIARTYAELEDQARLAEDGAAAFAVPELKALQDFAGECGDSFAVLYTLFSDLASVFDGESEVKKCE